MIVYFTIRSEKLTIGMMGVKYWKQYMKYGWHRVWHIRPMPRRYLSPSFPHPIAIDSQNKSHNNASPEAPNRSKICKKPLRFDSVKIMDGRTVPKILTGMEFGTWYGFLVRDLLVRYVVRIFVSTVRGTHFGTKKSVPVQIFFGAVRGTDQNFEILKK